MDSETEADFAAYVDSRHDSLVRSARLLGCTPADAEDLVQGTLLRCFRAWPRVRETESPDAYVYRVLVNQLRSGRGRKWSGEVPTAELPARAAPDFADEVTSRASMADALASLSDDHRGVLVLRFYADLSERQTAEALGIPAGTVKSRVSRALALLSEQLKPPRRREGSVDS